LPFSVNLTKREVIQLEDELHDALEKIFKKFFTEDGKKNENY